MIEEFARVCAARGGEVWVETERGRACGACSAESGCGQKLMQLLGGNKALHIKLQYSGPVQPGDRVILGLDEDAFLKSSLLVYGLPLFTFILAVTFAHLSLKWPEPWVAGAGLLGLMSGFILISLKGYITGSKFSSEPIILRVL